ncbi:MAG: hypothetical protein JKX97_05705 [Candidatus Lindowbacteria bacterium]|nr:hypothetical protein [Candidatus Lindowbacteria bacterium]
MEFRLSLTPGGGRRSVLSHAIKFRLEKELKRRAMALGLKVHGIRAERGKIVCDVSLQSHHVKSNMTRALWGAINGIIKREMPHLVRKGTRSPGASGFDYY